jgi:hypothetical protein
VKVAAAAAAATTAAWHAALCSVAPGQALDGTQVPLPAASERMIRRIPPV